MKSNMWVQQALSMFAVFVLVVAFSMVNLANAGNAVGELTVIKSGSAGETSPVTVNGEIAKSGRTVFSSSTISTPSGTEAIINFGKAGRIQIEPDSAFTIATDGNSLSGDLTRGKLTVLSAANGVAVRTVSGETVKVNAGESTSATSSNATKKAAPGPGGLDWWVWAAIIGGGVTAVVLIATHGDDDVASPVR